MSSLTYYMANKVGDLTLGNVAFSFPSTYYLGVSTTATQKDGTGITEPSDGAYARIAISNNKSTFSTSALGIINNLTEHTFSESTTNWGVITHWFLSDASTGGNICFQGELLASRNVETATTLVLPIGSFTNTTS